MIPTAGLPGQVRSELRMFVPSSSQPGNRAGSSCRESALALGRARDPVKGPTGEHHASAGVSPPSDVSTASGTGRRTIDRARWVLLPAHADVQVILHRASTPPGTDPLRRDTNGKVCSYSQEGAVFEAIVGQAPDVVTAQAGEKAAEAAFQKAAPAVTTRPTL
jgi:hypothetical protein